MSWQKLLRSNFFLFLLVVSLAGFSYFFVIELRGRYAIEQEIRQLEDQISGLEQGNKDLGSLIGYLKSPGYQEKELRRKLNLQRPGEHAVVLPKEATSTSQEVSDGQTLATAQTPNWRKWWNYFFEN